MTAPDPQPTITDLLEASSLGSPDAKAARAQVSPEDARRLAERSRELANVRNAR